MTKHGNRNGQNFLMQLDDAALDDAALDDAALR